MCGLVTIFSYRESAPKVDPEELRSIRDSMTMRGPDGAGEWFSEDRRIGMGHRRLSIIDLSEKGAQPMRSKDGSLVVSFNGEIYNYKELRQDLEKKGYSFQSQSDTEVLIHLYAEKGEEMVNELRGMFAFALWDSNKKVLFLVRDPYGIKPLYYSDDGQTVKIASQVKALLRSRKVSRVKDPAGAVSFFLTGSVPEPYTFYEKIRQVPAGSIVRIDENGVSSPRCYFSIPQIFHDAFFRSNGHVAESRKESFEQVHQALLDSVRYHFIADVPVAIFLSSGIDSSTLVALAEEANIRSFKTVTLAFKEFRGQPDDEAPLAAEIANRYGAEHQTFTLNRNDFASELPRVFEAIDQPSIDGVNTYFISKAASSLGFKVALSGLGADELFGGYSSFQNIPRMVQGLSAPSKIPYVGDALRSLYSSLMAQHTSFSPKIAGLLTFGGTYPGAYFLKRGLFMPWELKPLLGEETVQEGLSHFMPDEYMGEKLIPDPQSSFARVATLESSLYMRHQLLRDADWAGMAHSLEIRVPYVDSHLLKSLAPVLVNKKQKLDKKNLLAKGLAKPLPAQILSRSKTGFSVPIGEWLEEDHHYDGWRKIPELARQGCHWSRRWAYVVYEALQK